MEKFCRNCRAGDFHEAVHGECRLHPPIPVFSGHYEFPDVEANFWCLDWQPKKKPRAQQASMDVTVDEFQAFWAEYPRRIGKKAALKAFQNARDRPRIDDLLESIRKAKASPQWAKDGGQFIPHPATWLNRGQWADVPPETTPSVFEEFLARGSKQAEEGSECE